MQQKNEISSYAWALFALMSVAYMLTPFHRVSPAIMATDIMATLQLDAPAMGLLASVFFVTYGIMQIPGGLLTDGVGPRRLLPIMVAISAIGAVLFGMADSLFTALLGRGLIGIGVSVIFLCGMKIIGQWFPVRVFARMSGVFLGMGGVGMFLAATPLAVGCEVYGWRAMFYGCGVASFVLAAFLFFVVRDAPTQREPSQASGADRSGGVDWQLMVHNFKIITKHRDFWCACVWGFCQFNLHMSFGGLWGGTYLRDVHALSLVEAGNVLTMAGLGVVAGGFLMGWLCDVVFKSTRVTMLFASAVLTMNFTILALWGHVLPVWSLYIWFFMLSALGVPAMSVAFSAMRRIFGIEATGSACGLLNCLPSVGMLVFQPLTGFFLELYPKVAESFPPEAYGTACWLYVGAGALGLCGAFCMREHKE